MISLHTIQSEEARIYYLVEHFQLPSPKALLNWDYWGGCISEEDKSLTKSQAQGIIDAWVLENI